MCRELPNYYLNGCDPATPHNCVVRRFTAVLTLDLKASAIDDFVSQNSKLEDR